MSKWIKKDDKVLVVTGNEKGRTGAVLSKKGDQVVIQGINIRKKHAKRRAQVQTPTIIEIERPVHVSNVCLCDPDGKPIYLKSRTNAKGQKELFYLEGKKEVVHRTLQGKN
jgi:large subunit ribosomal protein L24